jgi:uncharacterized protein (TIGR03083 family)
VRRMTLDEYVTALEATWDGLASACQGLSEPEWLGPTDLPGWTVKDNVSHVVGIERLLLGEPFPDHVLPDDLPHVRNDAGRFMEVAVDLRRSRPGAEVLEELREVTGRRLDALRALPPEALDEDTDWLFGQRRALRSVLAIRVFDCWAHEQDVRRAVHRPGGLDSPAAHVSLDRMLRGLERVELPAAKGRSMLVTTTGAVESASTVVFGGGEPQGEPDVRLTVDFETFVRVVCGRIAYDDVAATVTVAGDERLGEELLRNAAITP